jgi:hypothetical protein
MLCAINTSGSATPLADRPMTKMSMPSISVEQSSDLAHVVSHLGLDRAHAARDTDTDWADHSGS